MKSHYASSYLIFCFNNSLAMSYIVGYDTPRTINNIVTREKLNYAGKENPVCR